MKVYERGDLLKKIHWKKMYEGQKKSFLDYSRNHLNCPPVGHLILEKGSLHIKYAHKNQEKDFVVKMGTGFPGNKSKGLPTADGCFLVFCAETGQVKSFLQDEGVLTDIRTVLAASVAVETLSERIPSSVGIIGTGRIGRLQAEALSKTLGISNFYFLGRSENSLVSLKKILKQKGLTVKTAVLRQETLEEVLKECSVILTTTPSKTPLLKDSIYLTNHLIVALGADEKGKQELEPLLLDKADSFFCDARVQSLHHGEFQSYKGKGRVLELGEVLEKPERFKKKGLRICDLTGLAAQDLQIVKDLCL